jgi:putative spermidine/putrescine transport system permease protein
LDRPAGSGLAKIYIAISVKKPVLGSLGSLGSLGALPALGLIIPVMGVGIARAVLGAFGLWSDFGKSSFSGAGFSSFDFSLARSIELTLLIASISTALALCVGALAAIYIYQAERHSRLLKIGVVVVLLTPHLVSAVSINLLLGDSGFLARMLRPELHFWPQFIAGPYWLGVIINFAWKESAFVAMMLLAVLPNNTSGMVEAALMLKVGPKRVVRQVLLPLVKPSLILSGGLTFIYTVGSYEAAWLLGRSYPEPLAVLTYRLFTNSDLVFRPQSYASALISLIIIATMGVAMVLWLRKVPRWNP